VESGFGHNDGPSSMGALGPMQFEPPTWALYGDGGNINCRSSG
jgi:membrane-bound lytic murein transglycosylase B